MAEFNVDHNDAFEAIEASLKGLPTDILSEVIDEAIYDASGVIVSHARQRNFGFRDRTGRLRKSIKRVSRSKRGRRFTNLVAGDNKSRAAGGVFYAHFVEEGTVKALPRRFLLPAILETAGQYVRAVATSASGAGFERAAAKARRRAQRRQRRTNNRRA